MSARGLWPRICSQGKSQSELGPIICSWTLSVPAEVQLIENMGAEEVIHLTAPVGQLRLLKRDRAAVKIGDQVQVNFDPQKGRLFETERGRAI